MEDSMKRMPRECQDMEWGIGHCCLTKSSCFFEDPCKQVHYEKLHLSKPHYPSIKTKKISYTIIVQLSFGYYN
jgi:hypothetical protein